MESLQSLCMTNIINQIFSLPPLIVEDILLETTNAMRLKIQKEIEDAVKTKFFSKMSLEIMQMCANNCTLIIPFMVSDMVKSAVENVPRKNYISSFKNFDPALIKECEISAELISRTCILERLETGEENFYESDSNSDDDYYQNYNNEYDSDNQIFYPDEQAYSP